MKSRGSRPTKATLASLAEAVGVSRTTVSNAYNNPSQLSEETRARIFAVAEHLGYSGPDPAARSLRTRRSGAIGVVFTDKLAYAFEDRASVDFLAGLSEVCQEMDSSMVLIPVQPGRGEVGISQVAQAGVDGFVVYSVAADDPALESIAARQLPTVICDQPKTPAIAGAAFVGIDDHESIQSGVRALTEAGHTHVGILCIRLDREQNSGFVSRERLNQAHMHVQKERVEGILAQLNPTEEWTPIVESYFNDPHNKKVAVGKLLTAHPELTAVACTTDSLALAVIDYCAEKGIRVPEDLAVTGFDGIEKSKEIGLTTIAQPNAEKGKTAGILLKDLIANPSTGRAPRAGERVILDTEWVEGHTVAEARASRTLREIPSEA